MTQDPPHYYPAAMGAADIGKTTLAQNLVAAGQMAGDQHPFPGQPDTVTVVGHEDFPDPATVKDLLEQREERLEERRRRHDGRQTISTADAQHLPKKGKRPLGPPTPQGYKAIGDNRFSNRLKDVLRRQNASLTPKKVVPFPAQLPTVIHGGLPYASRIGVLAPDGSTVLGISAIDRRTAAAVFQEEDEPRFLYDHTIIGYPRGELLATLPSAPTEAERAAALGPGEPKLRIVAGFESAGVTYTAGQEVPWNDYGLNRAPIDFWDDLYNAGFGIYSTGYESGVLYELAKPTPEAQAFEAGIKELMDLTKVLNAGTAFDDERRQQLIRETFSDHPERMAGRGEDEDEPYVLSSRLMTPDEVADFQHRMNNLPAGDLNAEPGAIAPAEPAD